MNKKNRDSALKINKEEREKLGDQPNLLAGAAFLETRVSAYGYKDYAEMARGERRLAAALKAAGDVEQATNGLARADLGIKKAMEYRKTYEIRRRDMLRLMDQLGSEFESFEDYLETWEAEIQVPQF